VLEGKLLGREGKLLGRKVGVSVFYYYEESGCEKRVVVKRQALMSTSKEAVLENNCERDGGM
jgi:hypothetical protein